MMKAERPGRMQIWMKKVAEPGALILIDIVTTEHHLAQAEARLTQATRP